MTSYRFPASFFQATRTKADEFVCLLSLHNCLDANDVSGASLLPFMRLRCHPNLVGIQDVIPDDGNLCFLLVAAALSL
jgi:hypothetical protein